LALIAAVPAFSQATSTGSVSGIVTDQQQAAIPGAEVLLLDPSTKETSTAKTNGAGRYIFVNVKSGAYNISVVKDGFSTFKIDALQVTIGDSLTVNAVLQVGSTSTTIEVTSTAGAELALTNATVGTSLSGQILQDLPNMGRDITTLALLQPGTTLSGNTAGSVSDQNTYSIDGGNASDDMSGNVTSYQTNFVGLGGTQTNGAPSANIPTPTESVEEFKVSSFNQGADFNNSIGGQIQIATKRGTDQWHGSLYGYYFATNIGAANSWAADHTPYGGFQYTPIVKNHRSRFGTAIGGPMTPKILGGKTYFFFNYEGERFPNVGTSEFTVPTALFKLGVVQVPNTAGVYTAYNLNPYTVTYNGQTYQPAMCNGSLCDPRGIGISPAVAKIWNQFMPLPNDPLSGDQYNTQGYIATLRQPLTENSFVGRIDHDFGDNWKLMSSYRYARIINLTSNQYDIGGALGSDKLGQPVALSPRPQYPELTVVGLTGSIKPNLIADFRISYQREYWQWFDDGAPGQLPGMTGAAEIANGGTTTFESSSALIPYNVNTQSTRTRFWDGHDNMVRGDLTWIKGKHLVQYGGTFQHNFDYHTRTDNGVSTNNQVVYGIGATNINWANTAPFVPSSVQSSSVATFEDLYSEVLGLVTQSQVAYTRTGKNLAIQPIGSSAFDKSNIPYYSGYFGDTWKAKPNLTLVYSLGYTLEMPPVEENGKQVVLVDSAGTPVTSASFLAQRQSAALQGNVYLPQLGYALVGNVGSGLKYPYNPFYGEWSPRVSAAWNPKADGMLGKIIGTQGTVIRGGYSRIWGRINGVNQVLVPLLGAGLIQAVQCVNPTTSNTCAGLAGVDPSTAFRLGVDGLNPYLPAPAATLPQPFYPGVSGNTAVGDTESLDPNYKPQRTDNFTISIQRQVTSKMIVEVGYIGRIIKNESSSIDLDAVPYMTTLGGQSFASAYAATYMALANGTAASAVPVQPFFENALGGATSATCKAYSSCTAYVASVQGSLLKNAQVSDLWAALNKQTSWTLGKTMYSGAPLNAASIEDIGSSGFGNYNAAYVTWRAREFHGMTALSSFTWARALGSSPQTQASSSYTFLNAFDPNANYGPNGFDIKFTYSLAMSYKDPFFKDQKGIFGKFLGGYTIAPLFTAQSGAPLCVGYTAGSQSQPFGESSSSSISSYPGQCAIQITPTALNITENANVAGSGGIGTNNPTGLNAFANPAAVEANFRKCILGYDTSCGGGGTLRGLPTWNLDAQVLKDVSWKEGRYGATFGFTFTNIMNHFQPSNPSLSLNSLTSFGKISGQSNTPRNMEFSLRLHF
jgi:hypothetical protein